MNNKNSVRSAVRKQIYIQYNVLFEELHGYVITNGNKKIHNTNVGREIVRLFRSKLGYSKSTYSGDIITSAYMNWKRIRFSGKSMYNSHITIKKMSNKHTEDFQSELDAFEKRMEGKGRQNGLFHRSDNKTSTESVIKFVRSIPLEQSKEIVARIKARGEVKGYIGNREIYDYCKEFNISPEESKSEEPKEDPTKHYHLLEEFQDFKIDNRECFVKKNDIENKVMVVIFDDNNEVREIKY